MASGQTVSHRLQASLLCVIVEVVEDQLLFLAHVVSDGVPVLHPLPVGDGVGDDLTVLNIDPPHLHQVSVVRSVVSVELSHHGLNI